MKIKVKADSNGSKVTGYVALVFTVISIILSVVLFIFLLTHGENLGSALVAGIVLGAFLGGFIPGLCRVPERIKKHKGSLLFFPFGWIYCMVVAYMIPVSLGWFYMLRDLKTYVKFEKED